MDNPNTNFFINSETDIDYKRIYLSLKKGIKWLALIPSITVVISIIYVLFIAKPVYTSETKLLLINSGSNQSTLSGLAGQFGFSIPSLGDNVNYLSAETLPEILASRTLARSILYTDFNSKKFDRRTSLLNIIIAQKDIDSTDSLKIIAGAINHISKNILNIKQIKRTNMFTLFINSPEPQLCAEISATVIKELDKLQSDFTRHELIDQKEFISERLDETQNELNQAETKLKLFREQNLQISLSPTLLLNQERLQREIEIQTQVYISLKQQYEQVNIKETKNVSSLKIIDPPNIPISHSKPKRRRIVLLAGFLGIIVGGFISLIKYYNECASSE